MGQQPPRLRLRLATTLLLATVTLSVGCESPVATPTATTSSRSTGAATNPGGGAATNPGGNVTGTVDAALKPLVDVAVSDLVRRLQVDAASITVVAVRSMEWPDRSLGCPQPGMAYPQTPVDGALIELSVAGTSYRYHSGGSRDPFLCENATD
jgi:hypothetical protein